MSHPLLFLRPDGRESRLLRVVGGEQMPGDRGTVSDEVRTTEEGDTEEAQRQRKEKEAKQKGEKETKEKDEKSEAAERDPTQEAIQQRDKRIKTADQDGGRERQRADKVAHDILQLQAKLQREQEASKGRNALADSVLGGDVVNTSKTEVADKNTASAAAAAVNQTAGVQAEQGNKQVAAKQSAEKTSVAEAAPTRPTVA